MEWLKAAGIGIFWAFVVAAIAALLLTIFHYIPALVNYSNTHIGYYGTGGILLIFSGALFGVIYQLNLILGKNNQDT